MNVRKSIREKFYFPKIRAMQRQHVWCGVAYVTKASNSRRYSSDILNRPKLLSRLPPFAFHLFHNVANNKSGETSDSKQLFLMQNQIEGEIMCIIVIVRYRSSLLWEHLSARSLRVPDVLIDSKFNKAIHSYIRLVVDRRSTVYLSIVECLCVFGLSKNPLRI